jgi:hypothetical protein
MYDCPALDPPVEVLPTGIGSRQLPVTMMTHLFKKLYRIYTLWRLRRRLMADFSALNAAVETLKGDAEALIAKVGTEDPSIQQNIDAATAAVNALDGEVKSALG